MSGNIIAYHELVRRVVNWAGSADYVVYKEGGLTRVKDGKSGKIAFSSTSDAEAIQYAVDNGNSIILSNGDFYIDTAINITKDGVYLSGSGDTTIHKKSYTINAISISANDVVVDSLAIDGNSTSHGVNSNYNGIYIYNSYRVAIKNCELYNNYYDGIFVNNSSVNTSRFITIINNKVHNNFNGFDIRTSPDSYIVGNFIYNNSNIGIYVGLSCMRSIIHNNFIDSNGKQGIFISGSAEIEVSNNSLLFNGGDGIYVYNNQRCIIDGNVVTGSYENNIHVYSAKSIQVINNYTPDCNNSGYAGIKFESVTNSLIGNNLSTNVSSFLQDYGIYVDANSSNVYVYDNVCWGNLTEQIHIDNYGSNKARGNYGYITDNGGTATFSGDGSTTQFTIAHGLVAAPSKYYVTPASADASGSFYVTVDGTNIYVNYSTAPAAGTSNVVLSWYAEV